MAKSFKFKNDIYLDSSSVVVGKIRLCDKFYNENINLWTKTKTVKYDSAYRAKLIFIWWQQSLIAYVLYYNHIVELGKYGNNTISYTINTTKKEVTFTLGDTGVMTVLDI